jgi:cytochrome c oxidase subunit II
MFTHLLLAFLQAPDIPEHKIANIFKPLASPGRAESDIAWLTIGITTAIFIVVATLIAYTIFRYRRKPGDDIHQEPAQVYGSNQIEIAWTVIPILIVFVLIGVTARVTIAVENAAPPSSALRVRVVGHQWWWEVEYPSYGFTTANEIHVPVSEGGKNPTYLDLQSVDVIHSFWVPQLSGKLDLIPNRTNTMWIDPQEPGVYHGNCAEYCGTQHANMFLRVIADPPDAFQKWIAGQQQPGSAEAQASAGKAVFESLSCVNCHVIKGTTANGKFGPDLTHLMSRREIGSGVRPNTRENLRAWVNDPQELKPGCFMPSMKLTDEELDQVVGYLETLK